MIMVDIGKILIGKGIKIGTFIREDHPPIQMDILLPLSSKAKLSMRLDFPTEISGILSKVFLRYFEEKLPQKIKLEEPKFLSSLEKRKENSLFGLYFKYDYCTVIVEVFETFRSSRKNKVVFFASIYIHNCIIPEKKAEEIIKDFRKICKEIVYPYILKKRKIRKDRKKNCTKIIFVKGGSYGQEWKHYYNSSSFKKEHCL